VYLILAYRKAKQDVIMKQKYYVFVLETAGNAGFCLMAKANFGFSTDHAPFLPHLLLPSSSVRPVTSQERRLGPRK